MHRLAALVLLLLGVTVTALSGQPSGSTSGTTGPAEPRASGRPLIHIGPAREIAAEFTGPERAVRALRAGQTRPLSLATADFDEDGVPDVVSGYKFGRGGLITLHLGNVDAIHPNAPEARERRRRGTFTDAAFLPGARVLETPDAPDFLGAGDFDADGHWDLVTASRANAFLRWHRGDGKGAFGPAQAIELSGKPTSFVTGDINRRDGLEDIVLAVDGPEGPEALVFEAPEGALQRAPERFGLPAIASSLVVRQMDEESPRDLLIAAGDSLVLVRGRDRRLSVSPPGKPLGKPAVVERVRLPFVVTSVAVGHFVTSDTTTIALLTRTGLVYEESLASLLQSARGGMVPVSVLQPPRDLGVTEGTLMSAKVSSLAGEDLLTIDRSQGRVHVVLPARRTDRADARADRTAPAILERPGETIPIRPDTVAVFPMRLNADGQSDLVMLTGNGSGPWVVPSGPMDIHTVTTTADTDDGTCDAHCSLREAITAANAGSLDTIEFDIPGPGPHVIRPGTNLPEIEASMTIDGTSEPDYAGTPIVVIDGESARLTESGPRGLQSYNAPVTIKGLAVINFDEGLGSYGIGIAGTDLTLEGNFIGLDAEGLVAPNTYGFECQHGTAVIGGTVPAARNIISGNASVGLRALYYAEVTIQGNYIGTDVQGLLARGNYDGVRLQSDLLSSISQTVGGTVAGAGNVISGNIANLFLSGDAIGLDYLVQGNYIGTTKSGFGDLGSSWGVFASGNDALIGGTTAAARNIISGNANGIRVSAAGNLLQGNYVGLAIDGSVVSTAREGVQVSGSGNTIGGTVPGAGNVISGNSAGVPGYGVHIEGGQSNTVAGNYIGTDPTGMLARPNEFGVVLSDGAFGNAIGAASGGNVISGQHSSAVVIRGAETAANWVSNNLIGLTANGASPLGNGGAGVRITESHDNLIGGTSVEYINGIAHNEFGGIVVSDPLAVGNVFLANAIYDNTGLGIDLYPLGPNPNDSDPGEGPNHLQNFPVITLAQWNGETVRVDGTLDSLPLSDFTIRIYVSEACDPSGYGEGKFYLGSLTVTTDAAGTAAFSSTFSGPTAWGEAVTATASHLGNTSEFSACASVGGVAPGVVRDVRFDSASPERLVWDAEPGASLYNLYIGTVSTMPGVLSPVSDSCQAAAIPETGGTLPAGSNPPPGQMIWFMVTAANQFGEGPLQPASSGPRQLNSTGFCGESCAHDMCAVGGPLEPACTLCGAIVCDKDPHCCNPQGGAWDFQCVQQVRTVCRSLACAEGQGQCAHSLCDPGGGPLSPGCDTPPLAVSCTAAVCQADPHCCQLAWDDACIARMATVCGYSCI